MIRRAVLAAGIGLVAARPSRAGAQTGESESERAIAFIRRSGEELGVIVHDPAPMAERRRRLREFLDRVVDVDGLARFCLGRFWNQATDAQRAMYVAVYHGVLLNAVLVRVGDYGGPEMHTVFGRAEPRDGVMLVPTVLERPGQPKATVTWALRMDGPAPRIVDLIIEGTSLRVTVRSDYAAFLHSHGDSVDALIDALRQQAAAAAGGG